MLPSLLDVADRREQSARLRRRNGLLGLIACVAIVATASQWGTQQGPVSLLQIDLGQHQAKVTVDAGDTQNGLTAAVQGLSTARGKLSASLRPLRDFRQMAGPPSLSFGQKQQLRLMQGPKGSAVVVTSTGAPATRGRDLAEPSDNTASKARYSLMHYKLSLLAQQLAAKKAGGGGKKGKGKGKKKGKKKKGKKGRKGGKGGSESEGGSGVSGGSGSEKLSGGNCGCCTKPGPCGCCGGTSSVQEDASIHNTGFFLNGNTISQGSNVIIYGNKAQVTHGGGGVANSGGKGPKGGTGGGGVRSGPGGTSTGGGAAGGAQGGAGGAQGGAGGAGGGGVRGAQPGAPAAKPGAPGAVPKGAPGAPTPLPPAIAAAKNAAAASGIVRKPMTKEARVAARKKLRLVIKKAKARRPTNPNYARVMAIIKKNKKRLMRGYLKKVMTFRGEMKEQPPAEKCGKQWAKLYSKYGKYARDMKKWYTSQIQFLSTQRRKFKKCTKKFTKCGAYKFKTKQINKYRTRFAALQKVFRARLEKWGTECKESPVGKKIQKADARAVALRVQQKAFVAFRAQVKLSKKAPRKSPEYEAAIKKTAEDFQKMLDFFRAKKDKWLKYMTEQKDCDQKYLKGFRYVKLYGAREMKLLRQIVNWLSGRQKKIKRTTKEYQTVVTDLRARKKEMADAYKGLYKHSKIVWHCFKKDDPNPKIVAKYKKLYRVQHKAHKWYGRAQAAKRARLLRKSARNAKKFWTYPSCGKRAQERIANIDKRWAVAMDKYTAKQAYWNKKMSTRKLGERRWTGAWYRWRHYTWTMYNWVWWQIRFDSKRSRYLKRCPDLYKAARDRVETNRKKRSEIIAAYIKEQKTWDEKLAAIAKDSKDKRVVKAFKRVANAAKRQAKRSEWRGFWNGWLKWEGEYWKTRPGTKEQREVLYKMKKWRTKYMLFWKKKIVKGRRSVKKAKKATKTYEARWKRTMKFRYLYLYALRRIVWFRGQQTKRFKKGTGPYKLAKSAEAKSLSTLHKYLKRMSKMMKGHIKVCRKGGASRRYWTKWWKWTMKWLRRYKAMKKSMKKKLAGKKKRRVFRMKVGSKKYMKNMAKIKLTWWTTWNKVKKNCKFWRSQLYKFRPGSYRWRVAWGNYRTMNLRISRMGAWYIHFLLHRRRLYVKDSNSWKKINASVMKWRKIRGQYRQRWIKRVSFWTTRIEKKNPTSKAVARLKRRAEAANKNTEFRKDSQAWQKAMIMSYLAQNPEDPKYKEFYPQVGPLREKIITYYRERAKYYGDKMPSKDKRRKTYRTLFRMFMVYQMKILKVHWKDLWFNKKMYKRYRSGTPEEAASRALISKARGQLKLDYFNMIELLTTRMNQIRNRSQEWNTWKRWYKWAKLRVKRGQGRRRFRKRQRSTYWFSRFTKGKVGGNTQKMAIEALDNNYMYLMGKYVSRADFWKTKLANARWGSFNWFKRSGRYVSYIRKQINWITYKATLYKHWRRMYKKDSAEFKDLTDKRAKLKEERQKLNEGYVATVKDWLAKLPKDSFSFKYYGGLANRKEERRARYREPVLELRKKEKDWWALRRESYKDEKYRAAFTAMQVQRDVVLFKFNRAAVRWAKKIAKRSKNKASKKYLYAFRRYIVYQAKLWREYHRGAYFTRYAMQKNVERTSNWFKKLKKKFKDNLVGKAVVYQNVLAQTKMFLKSQNPRSYLYRYYFRWYKWSATHYYKYRRRAAAQKKRSVTRRRRSLWHFNYKTRKYWRWYGRVWQSWVRTWVKYHGRLNFYRAQLHKTKLASGLWLKRYYRMSRYQTRITHWITYWLNFQRKLQRIYTREKTPQYESMGRVIDKWKIFRGSWVKVFRRRVTFWYNRLIKMKKGNTESFRALRRYVRRFEGKKERRVTINDLRAAERKVYYATPPVPEADIKAMSELRHKYVDVIDVGIKKWIEYVDKQSKGSRRWMWGYRRWFIWNYWAIAEYKRGYMIASTQMLTDQKGKDWKEVHDRLYAIWARFNKDKDGLYKGSWLYRLLTGTEYWMRKRFANFLDPLAVFEKGPWPVGLCYPLDDACKKLGVTDNLCGKCEADGKGWKLTNEEAGLRWGAKSFDDNENGAGSFQAQNVCILAAYGNKGKIVKKPTAACAATSTSKVRDQPHWFGNCKAAGCDTCTNAKLVADGFDWNKFASGNSCASDNDRDAVTDTLKCEFA